MIWYCCWLYFNIRSEKGSSPTHLLGAVLKSTCTRVLNITFGLHLSTKQNDNKWIWLQTKRFVLCDWKLFALLLLWAPVHLFYIKGHHPPGSHHTIRPPLIKIIIITPAKQKPQHNTFQHMISIIHIRKCMMSQNNCELIRQICKMASTTSMYILYM